jgi:uncharacterized protein YhhL (DUF1145 family)
MPTITEKFLGSAVFLTLLMGVIWAALTIFGPSPYDQLLEFERNYDVAPMRAAVSADAIDALVTRIDELGPRMLGRQGHSKAADFIESRYIAAGLEVYHLDGETAAPVTSIRRIQSEEGVPLPGVELYPFPPNSFQPVVTPEDGLVGELVLLTEEALLNAPDFTNAIGVLNLEDIPDGPGLEWTRYAQMGMRGIILVHPEGIDAMPWRNIAEANGIQSILPVNFLRVAATPELLNHIGETVRIDVQARFEKTPHRTVVGILRSGEPAREALVLNVAYDQYGILPDYRVNKLQTFPLAVHLALLDGLVHYKGQLQRDVIFVATGAQYAGFAGLDHLLRMLGPVRSREAASERISQDIEAQTVKLALMDRMIGLVRSPGFLENKETTLASYNAMTPADRRFFDNELRFVINSKVFQVAEDVLQKRIAFERGDTNQLNRPEYDAFLRAQFVHDDIATAAGLPLSRLFDRIAIGSDPEQRFTEAYDLRGMLLGRFTTLRDFHERELKILKQGAALNRLFSAYRDLYVFSPLFLPQTDAEYSGRDQVSFVLGGPGELFERASRILSPRLATVIDTVIQEAGLSGQATLQSPAGLAPLAIYRNLSSAPVPTSNWNAMGYRAFSLVNTDRLTSYRSLSEPMGTQLPTAERMEPSLNLAGELVLAMAKGFGSVGMPPQIQPNQFSGRVYASDVGRSLIPNFPLADVLVTSKPNANIVAQNPGRYQAVQIFTDPYGRYSLLDASSTFSLPEEFNLQAVVYGEDGLISHIKDESSSTQNLYRSIGLNIHRGDLRGVNLVAFRASPVAVLDLINPQTLRPFSAVRLLQQGSLTDFNRINQVATPDGVVSFIPPESYFFATFRAGTPDNELVQVIRSYMSGNEPEAPTMDDSISGEGYLASDHTILQNVALEQARSMNRLNDSRIGLQQEKGLADRHTIDFHEQSGTLLQDAIVDDEEMSFFQRVLTARDSLTYSIIIHPILRQNINDAVISILWYMALLVPFMFFFEKLVFGFADIRKQLAAQAIIFLVVFLLLRLLHPAFEMIRSSLMILLGFFILMISLAITLLFAGKFRENLQEIKQRRGQVAAAEINTMGVIGTAFMLGLNNMHRRKVRTGLTCMTLVLITFAMICFTSIYSDFEDTEIGLGPAAYQGLLVKNEKFSPISATERFAIDSRFGFAYPVAPRSMFVGQVSWQNERMNPELEIQHQSTQGRMRAFDFGSIIRFNHNEPLRHMLRFVSDPYWFEEDLDEDAPLPVILPETMAERLDIRVEDVNAGTAFVRINGGQFQVRGIFDEASYLAMRDLDGRPILPFDIRGLRDIERIPGAGGVLGDEDGVLMPPSEIVLAPHVGLGIPVAGSNDRLVSLALDFEKLSLREARDEIVRFLEQRARPAFYGVDGTAYRGSRMRVASFAGLVDLIIPLIIAALTVLNTMKGSVYERRDEIYVYNAVGIAPKFIFFMFFAEAFVYAVVGCVAGYLLSQGTGTILTALDLTGGLNMTFASVNSIYASLAVVAAVFISTYFPAKSAMEIAAPAEDSGWDMPEPEDDTYSFNLPFTFDRRERVAVLAFFQRFLLDHGEGGSGNFSAGPPHFEVHGSPEGGPEKVVPSIQATIWLKPYDLGVSQTLIIETPHDPETGDFIASLKMVRASGTRESWMRVNRNFMVGVRKQFLHWRAVSPAMKADLYEEARRQIQQSSLQEASIHG